MQFRRPWLLVVLPALSAGVAVALKTLIDVGESVHDLERTAIFGALFGLIFALVLTRRPAAPPPT